MRIKSEDKSSIRTFCWPFVDKNTTRMDVGSTNGFKWQVYSFATYAYSCRICPHLPAGIFIVFMPIKNKKLQRANATAIRVCCRWIHPTIGWRQDKHGTHKHAHVDSLSCITCSLENNAFSVLHYVIKVNLHYLMLHRVEIHSALELSRTALLYNRLPPRSLASSRGYSLAIMAFLNPF